MSLDILSSTTRTTSEVLGTVLTHLRPHQRYVLDATFACAAIWALLRWLRTSRQRFRTTQLRGPPSESLLYGVGKRILGAQDPGAVYEAWAQEYGPAFTIPWTLGKKKIVLCDPKAVAHFYAKDTWTYIHTPTFRKAIAKLFGKGLLWANGEDHRRQRKSLTPAFSVAAIRELTWIFYESVYKTKGAWDVLIESSGTDSTLIDVQTWMGHISLDTIGLAGFSHHFGALEGRHEHVTEVFDTFNSSSRSTALNKGLTLLAQVFPFLEDIPTTRGRLFKRLDVAIEQISSVLLARTQNELEMGVVGGKEEKSVIGLLIKGANGSSEFHLTQDEVMAQMKVLLLAGYETTSASLSWALLELSRNPDVQTKLRNELFEHGTDPTYDELTNNLPYLDAIVHEVLRLHPPISEITRLASEDDVIPLSKPTCTNNSKQIDSLTIAKGTLVTTSIQFMNCATSIWGEDAKVFRPSRWLGDKHGYDRIPAKAKEIQGHRHLLTFVDGPRTCLGKNFALTELKTVLTVLIKNFVCELRDGVDTKIEIARGMLLRPKLVSEVGFKLPMRVRPYIA